MIAACAITLTYTAHCAYCDATITATFEHMPWADVPRWTPIVNADDGTARWCVLDGRAICPKHSVFVSKGFAKAEAVMSYPSTGG